MRIATRLSRPQNQNNRAKFSGQISQNGACSEKLPSSKRKELERPLRTDATASAAEIACGKSHGQAPLNFRSKARGRASSATRITADSFDSRARQNAAMDAAYQAAPRRSRNWIQHRNDIRPKSSSSGSVDPDSHMTAS